MPGWGNFFAQPAGRDPPSRPGLWDEQRRFVKLGNIERIETSNWNVEWIIVSVQQGVAGVWPAPHANVSDRPPWTFPAGGPPQWLPVSLVGDRFVLTVKAIGGSDLDISVTFAARSNDGFDYSRREGL